MPVQTAVNNEFNLGFAGQEADNSPKDGVSARNSQGAAIPFGVALVKGTNDDDAKLPTGASVTADFIGIARHTHAYMNYDLAGTSGIPANGVLTVAKKGRYLVAVEAAVTKGALAFFRIAANGGNTQLGAWRGDADTASAVSSGFRFGSSTTGAGLAVLDLNLP